MKIPKTLKIGAHIYNIELAEDKFEGETCGIAAREKRRIVINSTLPQTHQESSLFHEIFHAMNSELDHTLLDSLSEQFYQVLKDNRLLK